MSDPRVVFLEGSGDAPSTLTLSEKGMKTWILWRLLSANNRDLGRGQNLFASHDQSVEHFRFVRENIERVEPVITHVDAGLEWFWVLMLDEQPVARSSRGYERLRECHYCLAQFLESVSTAEVVDDPERIVRLRQDHAVPGTFEPFADAL